MEMAILWIEPRALYIKASILLLSPKIYSVKLILVKELISKHFLENIKPEKCCLNSNVSKYKNIYPYIITHIECT